ncbi:MAG TPA: iron-sulfur cluster assembly scaffold protein [Thermodesulfobacteriota bacterium]|nr:iron-sulfur cluster assembly scaffold protein [Thermodesulfobacteriota bacterium]
MNVDQMEFVLDHYKNPRNSGQIADADYSYEEGNPSCGDKIRIDIKVADNKIAEARFSGKGCAISQASASILTEMIEGMELDAIKEMDGQEFLETLGVNISPIRYKCALLALKVLKTSVFGDGVFEYEH